jgi:hypothetical protein
MAEGQTLFQFGTLAGVPLMGNIGDAAFSKPPMTVTLTAAYLMQGIVPGQDNCIMRPFQTSPSNQAKDVLPQLWAIGTTFELHAPEATALINAGAATLVSVD